MIYHGKETKYSELFSMLADNTDEATLANQEINKAFYRDSQGSGAPPGFYTQNNNIADIRINDE